MGPLFETYFLRVDAARPGRPEHPVLVDAWRTSLWVMVVLALFLPFIRNRKKTGVLAQTVQAGHES